MNEKGLAVGNFLFPGSPAIRRSTPANADQAIASYQVAVYLLGTCATVKDAVAAVEGVRVGLVAQGLPALLAATALRRPGRRGPQRRDRIRRRPTPRPRKPAGRRHQLADLRLASDEPPQLRPSQPRQRRARRNVGRDADRLRPRYGHVGPAGRFHSALAVRPRRRLHPNRRAQPTPPSSACGRRSIS